MRTRERDKARKTHVKNGSEEPVEQDNGDSNVGCSPPRDGKRRANVGYLTPVKGEDTHGHAVSDAEHLVDFDIFGSHPADPGEGRKSGKEIGRQEVYDNNESGSKRHAF